MGSNPTLSAIFQLRIVDFGLRIERLRKFCEPMKPQPRRIGFFWVTVLLVTAFAMATVLGQSHARRRGTNALVCGNPKIACKTSVEFQAYDLPFRVPPRGIIIETQPFYAIILKSHAASEDRCDDFISEAERLSAQTLFPEHKVFTSRCVEPGNLFYTDENRAGIPNISDTNRLMAVYAGTSLAEAKQFLAKVKSSGKFPGANIRRMRTGYNGT